MIKITLEHKDFNKIHYYKSIFNNEFREKNKIIDMTNIHPNTNAIIYTYLQTGKINKDLLHKDILSDIDYLGCKEIEDEIKYEIEELSYEDIIYLGLDTKDNIIHTVMKENMNGLIFADIETFEKYMKLPDNVYLIEDGKLGFIHCLTILSKDRYYFELLQTLLSLDNININLQNNQGVTALMYSGDNSKEDIVKMLLEHPNIDVNIKNNYGNTALLVSCIRSNSTSSENIVQMLLEHPNIDVNLQNNEGNTALMGCCSNSNNTSSENTVQMLLEHSNIDVNLQNNDGNTALIMSTSNSKKTSTENTVQLLLANSNCNVNLQNNDGNTALMQSAYYSATSSSTNTVRMLLEHPNIDTKIKNKKGHTANDVAFLTYSTPRDVKILLSENIINCCCCIYYR